MNEYCAWLPIVLLGLLAGCSGATPGAPPPTAEDGPAMNAGARLFNANCIACHASNGRGIPGVYPSLAGSPVVLGDPKELALWVIKGRRPPSLSAGRYPTSMIEFGWMKPADAAALLTFVRASFGNAAPPVDAATIAAALGPS
jgi:mono/diheme cytochrome c family protein